MRAEEARGGFKMKDSRFWGSVHGGTVKDGFSVVNRTRAGSTPTAGCGLKVTHPKAGEPSGIIKSNGASRPVRSRYGIGNL
jgi:hypothetical protein